MGDIDWEIVFRPEIENWNMVKNARNSDGLVGLLFIEIIFGIGVHPFSYHGPLGKFWITQGPHLKICYGVIMLKNLEFSVNSVTLEK